MTPPKKRRRRRRPAITKGNTTRCRSGCGELIVTVNGDDKGVVDVFCRTEGGGCPAQSEAIARLLSFSLQNGLPAKGMIRQLRAVKCDRLASRKDKSEIECQSCPDGIASVLEEKVKKG